jgi:hypothetical protein
MKLLILLWFLITIKTGNFTPTKVIKVNTLHEVDSVFIKYNIPYKADSLFKYSNYLEIRKQNFEFYIENKNDKSWQTKKH